MDSKDIKDLININSRLVEANNKLVEVNNGYMRVCMDLVTLLRDEMAKNSKREQTMSKSRQ